VNFSAEANRTFYIIVAGYGTSAGQFMAYFYNIPGTPAAPLADVCPGINIPSVPFTDYGNTNCMANNYFNCVTSNSREMVYYLSRPQCERVTVSLCGSGYDTGLGIYGGVCPNIAPLIICNDDNYCGGIYTLQSTATFQAEANTNYQILVHGFSSNSGPYVLNVTSVPCPVAPNPVTDLVITPANPTSADVRLNWSPKANATAYRVYYSADQNNIVLPANLVATTSDTFAVIAGVVSNPNIAEYFQIVAINTSILAPPPDDENDSRLDGMSKDQAVQGPIVENPAFFMNNENVEHKVPGKVK
jgi:hypothetical protein